MEKELLKLEGITKIYSNGFIANKNVSMTVNEGEIHALIGENGAEQRFRMSVFETVLREQAQLVFRHDGRSGDHVVDHAAKLGYVTRRRNFA